MALMQKASSCFFSDPLIKSVPSNETKAFLRADLRLQLGHNGSSAAKRARGPPLTRAMKLGFYRDVYQVRQPRLLAPATTTNI